MRLQRKRIKSSLKKGEREIRPAIGAANAREKRSVGVGEGGPVGPSWNNGAKSYQGEEKGFHAGEGWVFKNTIVRRPALWERKARATLRGEKMGCAYTQDLNKGRKFFRSLKKTQLRFGEASIRDKKRPVANYGGSTEQEFGEA